MNKVDLFCAKCQKVTPHSSEVDGAGEFLFRCKNDYIPEEVDAQGIVTVEAVPCDRFIKMPGDVTDAQAVELAKAHQEVNQGQVSIEVQDKKLVGILDALKTDATLIAEAAPVEPFIPEVVV